MKKIAVLALLVICCFMSFATTQSSMTKTDLTSVIQLEESALTSASHIHSKVSMEERIKICETVCLLAYGACIIACSNDLLCEASCEVTYNACIFGCSVIDPTA